MKLKIEKLFGYDVVAADHADKKYYVLHSVFDAFGTGQKPNQPMKLKYATRLPGSHYWFIEYDRLRAWCQACVAHSRGKFQKPALAKIIALREAAAPSVDQPMAPVLENNIKVPDTVTVEASTLRSIVETLGIGRVHAILQELGLIPDAGEAKAEKTPQPLHELLKKKLIITVTAEIA